jgi:hypothetical protein
MVVKDPDPLGTAERVVQLQQTLQDQDLRTRENADKVRRIIRASRQMSEAIRALVAGKYADKRAITVILKDILADYDYTAKGRVR